MRKQRAVTLIEVLISIAVVAIGLLGVAALIPVAGYQTEQGARNDRKSNVGRRALREVRIRGLTNTANLAEWDTAAVLQFGPFAVRTPAPSSIPKAFCLDPYGFALAENGKTENGYQLVPAFDYFRTLGIPGIPGLGALPCMPRLTTTNFFISPGPPPPPTLLVGPAAEEVFVFQDDLEFESPDDVKLPPVQKFLRANGAPSKRYARGRFSWMVTMTPVSSGVSGYYTLSTVIFAERRTIGQPQWSRVENSSVIQGESIHNVVLTKPNVDIPVGNWIMLAKRRVNKSPPGDGTFRWYRVSSSASANGKTFLTLNGQPWDPPVRPPYLPIYALMPTNVVAVYTRSIQFP